MTKRPSPLFIRGINFELTYQCNLDCNHCLQQHIRTSKPPVWIDTEKASQALKEAKKLRLTKAGVNFTGGEVFLPAGNLLELVETARSLELNVRINTNGWWGNKENIKIGNTFFKSAGHVVSWLREHEVAVLALSFDNRYQKYPEVLSAVISIIRHCENLKQPYQIVTTGVSDMELLNGWYTLVEDEGISPHYMIPLQMDLIDIGGAAGDKETFDNPHHLSGISCEGSGFIRPHYLHINPYGGVRSCLYASAGGWLGNIYHHSLQDIIAGFTDNKVVKAFSLEDMASLTEKYLSKNTKLYQSINHSCTLFIIMARLIEEYNRFEKKAAGKPRDSEKEEILNDILREINHYSSEQPE